MPASASKPSKGAVGHAVQQSVAPAPTSERPFIRFYHSESLRVRTLAVLTAIEDADDSRRYRHALSEVALELVDSGLEYCLMRPLRHANMGFVIENTAIIAIGGVKRVLTPVVRTIIGCMNEQQLLAISSDLRDLME